MTAHEALLKAEELILEARQRALDKAEGEDELGKVAWDTAAATHAMDAKVCRLIREDLE